MGNPEAAKPPEAKLAEPQTKPEPPKAESGADIAADGPPEPRFPPITEKTLCIQNPKTGDFWLGFNPARFPRSVLLAWMTFQVEQIYEMFQSRVREAQRGLSQKKQKRSLLNILSGGKIQ